MELNEREKMFLEQSFQETARALAGYAYASVKDWEVAAELVQSVYVVACKKIEDLMKSENPKGWLFQTMKYKIYEHERAVQKNVQLICKIMEQTSNYPRYAEMELDLDILYESDTTKEELSLLKRFYIEGETMREIAAADGISVEACKKRIQRARKRLLAQFEQTDCI